MISGISTLFLRHVLLWVLTNSLPGANTILLLICPSKTHTSFFWHIESLKVSSTHIFRAWQSEDLEVILVQAWEVSRWRASQSQDPWYWARYRLTKNKRKRQKDPWHWWTQYWDWPWRWGLNDWEYLIVGWRFTCSRPQLLSNQRL